MVHLISAAILGLVEGVTEFLPISSTGHLIVASQLLKFEEGKDIFDIVIQLGAILAVVWYYRTELTRQVKSLGKNQSVQSLWTNLFLAFLPAAAIGFLFHKQITAHLFTPTVVAVSMIIGGIILWWVEKQPKKPVVTSIEKISRKDAAAIGLAQVVSLIPGVSRSGATIVGGLLSGLDREVATEFSFYLAIPTLGIATLFELLTNLHGLTSSSLWAIVVGLIVSFIVALAAVSWLLRYISSHDFRGFAIYRIVVGILILLFFR